MKRALLVALALATAPVSAQRSVILPSEPGRSERGASFQMPPGQPIPVRDVPALRVDRVEVHSLAAGTDAGAAGDVLVTIQGQGFLETSTSPRLELGPLVLDDTMVSAEGTQLFVVIPREQARRIEALQFDAIAIVNPGGLERGDAGRSVVRITPRELVRAAAGAPEARLVFRGGFFQRELAAR